MISGPAGGAARCTAPVFLLISGPAGGAGPLLEQQYPLEEAHRP
jgi:hypothetical protein